MLGTLATGYRYGNDYFGPLYLVEYTGLVPDGEAGNGYETGVMNSEYLCRRNFRNNSYSI